MSTDAASALGQSPQAQALLIPPRSRRIATANRMIEGLWQAKLASTPSLDPAAMKAAAVRRTKLDDFGAPEPWARNLVILADALEREARLSSLGRVIAHGQIVALLSHRLRAVDLWRRHPEIARVPLAPPIIILGQMRSGTTRMQRLLACDPGLGCTRFYESWNPLPSGRIDDRRLRATVSLGVARLLNPDFNIIHPTGAAAPDEEIGLQSFSFFGSAFEAQWRVPAFVAHVEAMDARPVYAEFRLLLQTLAWLRGGDRMRPLVLKVPQFTQDLPALIDAFPDARLLCLQRDERAVIASSASLVRNQMAVQSHEVDPMWIGREWTRKVALRRDRMEQALADRPDVPRHEICFEAMNHDWLGEMQGIYAFLNRPLTPMIIARMTRVVSRAQRAGLDRHRYDPTEFGLECTPA